MDTNDDIQSGDLVRHFDELCVVLHVSREFHGPARVTLMTGRTRAIAGTPLPTITASEGDLELVGSVDFSTPFTRGKNGTC